MPSVQLDKMSSIFCSTVEFSLDFLKVIITGNLYLASSTDCHVSRGSAYEVTVAERRAGPDQSSRNKTTIYTGLFISPSGTSELDCATTKTDTAERSISIGRESLKVFDVEYIYGFV